MEGAVTLEYSRVFSRVASPCTASHVADSQSQSFSRSHPTRTGQYVYTPAFLKGGPSFSFSQNDSWFHVSRISTCILGFVVNAY